MSFWESNSSVVQSIGDHALLYDLSLLKGSRSVLSRIPSDMGGVYAWYRRFKLNLSADTDAESFSNQILDELRKEHSSSRKASLAPVHQITLSPETHFSKEDLLRKLSLNREFRSLMAFLLENSLIFQQPLYIGKAKDFHSRIKSHLREDSILRERLKLAGHNIDQCRLLIVIYPGSDTDILVDESSLEKDSDFLNDEFSNSEPEQVIEDILSRLFLPSFTLRYG